MLEKISLRIRCQRGTSGYLLTPVLVFLISIGCFVSSALLTGQVYAGVPNRLYSLSGAQYQLYTDSSCETKAKDSEGNDAVLTTDENGDSDILVMAPGTYYAKEIKPSKGYRLDTDKDGNPKVYTIQITEDDTESDPATFTSSEPPVFGVPELMVFKSDPKGEYDYTALTGAEFTLKYYDVETKAEISGAEPKDQWTFKTVKKEAPEGKPKGSYMAGFDWQKDEPVSYEHAGSSAFYEVIINGETKRVLPLGWFTIEETAPPQRFWPTDKMYYGHIYQPEEGSEAVTVIEESSKDGKLKANTLTFIDKPYPVIKTSASAQQGNREVKDVVSYENLKPGDDYIFRGWLVDTASGQKVPGSDGSVKLTADKDSGSIEMVLNAEKYDEMSGRSLTAFEELYLVKKEDGKEKEILMAEHKDIKDKNQTVEFFQDIKVKKNVTGNLGDLSKTFEYTVALTGLEPDKPYKIEGFDEKTFNADHDGKATIPLKLMDDKSVTIKQLPRGAAYQITEAASDHISEFRVFSEDMEKRGAKIIKASGSNGAEAAKELSTALETVDLLDGTVVVLWENNRDLATITAVPSNLDIWALAGVLILGCSAALIMRRKKHTER